jgi:hypothetical protein
MVEVPDSSKHEEEAKESAAGSSHEFCQRVARLTDIF